MKRTLNALMGPTWVFSALLHVLTSLQINVSMSSAAVTNNANTDSPSDDIVHTTPVTTEHSHSQSTNAFTFPNAQQITNSTHQVSKQNLISRILEESRFIKISLNATCDYEEVVRTLTFIPDDKPTIIQIELTSEVGNSRSPYECWLHLKGTPGFSPSVLLLDHGCKVQGSMAVVENLGFRRISDFGSGGVNRHWVSCQRAIRPGADYVSSGEELYLGVAVNGTGLYTATVHVGLTPPLSPARHLHRRNVTSTLGYIQSSGIHLHPSYLHQQYNMYTYSDDLDLWSHLAAPAQHVTLISVAVASFGLLPKDKLCEDRLELWKGANCTHILWTLCAQFESLPPAELIQDSPHTALHFVSGHTRFSPLDFPLKHGCGFRVVFSFHQPLNTPQRVDNYQWNCSGSAWPELEAHFACNLVSDCTEGEDEQQCFYTPCAQNGVLVGNLCYSLHRAPSGATWNEANTLCALAGGRLAPLNRDGTTDVLVRTFRLDLRVKTGQPILVGIRTADTTNFLYRNLFQYCDRTIHFPVPPTKTGGNTYTAFGVLFPLSIGFVITYFKALWKLQEDCQHHACLYLCESNMATLDDPGTRTENSASIELAALNMSTLPFHFVRCLSGHFTQAFLTFDPESQCVKEEGGILTDCSESDDPFSPACQLDWSFLPAPFTCQNGVQHVPYTLVCDHVTDCSDDSDEDFCSFPECVLGVQYLCQNKKECHPQSKWCDGAPDCTDYSDETGCTHRTIPYLQREPPPYIVHFEAEFKYYGYPKLSHINDSHITPCPPTHFKCPSNAYCLPVYMRCNGLFDCPDHLDEKDCDSYVCPNFYRCRGSHICVHPEDLCDGFLVCLQHDDERFCNLTCPEQCVCLGHSMNCPAPFAAKEFPHIRYLDGKHSGIKLGHLGSNSLLVYLNLASCRISGFDNVPLPNLLTLDLSNNEMMVLNLADVHRIPELRQLYLSGNPLISILPMETEHELRELDVSLGNLKNFDTEITKKLATLVLLNLSYNAIESIQATGLRSLPSTLRVLDSTGCPIKTFPQNLFVGLNSLHDVYANNYKLCCKVMLPPSFISENCRAPFNEMSSCDDLLRSNIYRVPLFLLAGLALLGNFTSFSARLVLRRGKTVRGFGVFVLHLCFSDFLMGVYLVSIGAADRAYQGRYLWEDVAWRHSVFCRLAGCVSMASNEISAFMICLITLDRFIVLRFPFTRLRFGYSSAQLASASVWITGIVLAVIPLLPATTHWQFYSQTGICIPLPVTRSDFSGHNYAFGVMITLNFFLFLLIASGQAFVYVSIQSSRLSDSESSGKSQDATIARRLVTVVVSDFLCWFPIGLLGLLASSGVPIPGEVNVAMAIFVLPLNSALNPFLYTFNMIQEYSAKRRERLLFQKVLHQRDVTEENVEK